ncbi:hypothetical protein CRG98_009099 [Punica granatum]|uniref:Uncharacterized protein n=1 Tax=Punica granatum TaxID=22663 RepID=A0A2I0KQ24_PUNGR|nr:hypothetical protein CRG98_009099 [Punica granatum]
MKKLLAVKKNEARAASLEVTPSSADGQGEPKEEKLSDGYVNSYLESLVDSDEERDGNSPVFNANMEIAHGMEFEDLKVFKHDIREYNIELGREFAFDENDKVRVRAHCVDRKKEVEYKDSWKWFLENLIADVVDPIKKYTFISDKQKLASPSFHGFSAFPSFHPRFSTSPSFHLPEFRPGLLILGFFINIEWAMRWRWRRRRGNGVIEEGESEYIWELGGRI